VSPIHPTALIDPGAEVDAGAVIGPYCIVGAHVRLHAGVRLLAHVVVDGPCEIGPDVEVHPFARLGGPPQHVQHRNEPTRLEIGAGCIIREHVSMNRGTARGAGITRIGPNGYFMAQAHVGHDCDVGARVTLAQAATLGGHVRVGDGAMLGGLCAVHQRCRVGRLAMIGGLAAVVGDVPPFTIAAGNHAQLAGLNAVGLRREGVSGEALHALRSAYKHVFEGEGVFAERVAQARGMGGADPLVLEFLDFLSMARPRPLAHARAPA
jgi:UDP-N-acetylglucosamine acyltransferase